MLAKEGGTSLSRAFPSKRFFVLLGIGRLEYYKECSVRLSASQGSSDDIAAAIELNEWGLVVFVHAQLQQISTRIAVGDILMSANGVPVLGGNLRVALDSRAATMGEHVLDILRPRGEIPIRGALAEAVGETRLRITVSRKELIDSRPPYLLIAPNAQCRDEWLQLVQAVAHTSAGSESRPVSIGWSEMSDETRTSIEMAIESVDGAAGSDHLLRLPSGLPSGLPSAVAQPLDAAALTAQLAALSVQTAVMEHASLHSLPMELLQSILEHSSAQRELPRAACVSHTWRTATEAVARRRLLLARPWQPPLQCPCPLRCLATLAISVDALGVPIDRPRAGEPGWPWQDELGALRQEASAMLGEPSPSTVAGLTPRNFWEAFPLKVIYKHTFVTSKIDAGWPEAHAFVLAGLAGLHAAIGRPLFSPEAKRFPTSLRAWLDAVAYAAALPPPIGVRPIRLFANLSGADALADVDGVWQPEKLTKMRVGERFVTNAAVDAKEAMRCHLRSDDGWFAYIGREAQGGDAAFELQDSDLVCFTCRPNGPAGYRTLVFEPRPNAEDAIYLLPPFAHVTLERVDEACEWEVTLVDDGGATRRPRRRLYTVSVSFGC